MKFAVVLASRPYQNDTLVNHDLSKMFTKAGIAVLTADSLPEVNQTELSKSRLDIVNKLYMLECYLLLSYVSQS